MGHSAHNRSGQSQRPQFYSNNRGRGRGFGYQNYRRQRHQGNGRDIFHDFSGNQYPPYNPNEAAE